MSIDHIAMGRKAVEDKMKTRPEVGMGEITKAIEEGVLLGAQGVESRLMGLVAKLEEGVHRTALIVRQIEESNTRLTALENRLLVRVQFMEKMHDWMLAILNELREGRQGQSSAQEGLESKPEPEPEPEPELDPEQSRLNALESEHYTLQDIVRILVNEHGYSRSFLAEYTRNHPRYKERFKKRLSPDTIGMAMDVESKRFVNNRNAPNKYSPIMSAGKAAVLIEILRPFLESVSDSA